MAKHVPKYAKYQFTKFGRLTARNLGDVTKIILNLLFLTERLVLRKKQKGYQIDKNCKNVLNLTLGALVVRAYTKIYSRSIYQTLSSDCKRFEITLSN